MVLESEYGSFYCRGGSQKHMDLTFSKQNILEGGLVGTNQITLIPIPCYMNTLWNAKLFLGVLHYTEKKMF